MTLHQCTHFSTSFANNTASTSSPVTPQHQQPQGGPKTHQPCRALLPSALDCSARLSPHTHTDMSYRDGTQLSKVQTTSRTCASAQTHATCEPSWHSTPHVLVMHVHMEGKQTPSRNPSQPKHCIWYNTSRSNMLALQIQLPQQPGSSTSCCNSGTQVW
jgi:hypothetical protein